MKRRRWLSNPRTKRRIALGVIAAGGLLAAGGAMIRAEATGSDTGSGSYLLDAAGWLIVVAGAAIEARAAQLFLQATPGAARRRAIGFTIVGVLAALIGCVLASTVADSAAPAPAAGGAMFALVAGVGIGLAGFFSLAWHVGGEYAAGRIERLSDEDW